MRSTRRLAALGAVLALGSLLAACGSTSPKVGSGSAVKGQLVRGGVVNIAQPSGATPNDIFPLGPATNANGYNVNLTMGSWPSLVYVGDGTQSDVNAQESLYSSLTWSNNDQQVTIVLKPWKWSDGQPITARDFTFVYNLLKYNYNDWIDYTQGLFPTDVTKVLTPNSRTIVLDLNRSYNPAFYTDDELSYVPLLPQHVMDRTSLTGKVSNYDLTKAGADAVWTFLQKQGEEEGTFTSSPLWQVVDGPWKITTFLSDGYYAWTPNKNYSGPDKPILSKVIYTPFTDDDAEMDTLRSGTTLSLAALPLNDIKQIPALEAEGYTVATVPTPGRGRDRPEPLQPGQRPDPAPAVHPPGVRVPGRPAAHRQQGVCRVRRPWQRAGAGALRSAVGLPAGEVRRPVPVLAVQGHRAAQGSRLEGRPERRGHLSAARLWPDAVRCRDHGGREARLHR